VLCEVAIDGSLNASDQHPSQARSGLSDNASPLRQGLGFRYTQAIEPLRSTRKNAGKSMAAKSGSDILAK
jgi:hypothetical protein